MAGGLTVVLTLASACATPGPVTASDAASLNALWQAERIYFVPRSPGLNSWEGKIYDYATQKCSELRANTAAPQAVTVQAIDCPSRLRDRALFPYEKIADFGRFKKRFVQCLETSDEPCLRGLISRTAQLSFGFDPPEDRRDRIFRDWKRADFRRMAKQLRQGTSGAGEERIFPATSGDGGLGLRGAFRLIDSGWRLVSYVAGD
jgi:hypothetical protein